MTASSLATSGGAGCVFGADRGAKNSSRVSEATRRSLRGYPRRCRRRRASLVPSSDEPLDSEGATEERDAFGNGGFGVRLAFHLQRDPAAVTRVL